MGIPNSAVQNLIQELKIRIELLTSTKARANLDEQSYQQIIAIIGKYTKRVPSELRPEDITLFKIEDIQTILITMGISKEDMNRILIAFNPNVYKYQTNQTTPEIEKYFESLRKMLVNYVSDYNDINSAQKSAQDEKVSEYETYINLLSQEKLTEPFEDFEGILRLMTTLATSNEDKWQILAFIAEQNIKTSALAMADINYHKRISDMIDTYVKSGIEIAGIIEKELYRRDIDVDLIPSLAQELAAKYGENPERIQNILVTIMAVNVHSTYLSELEKDSLRAATLRDILESVLEHHIDETVEVISASKTILEGNESLIATSIDIMDDEILEYVEKSIREIEEEGYTREEAIDLKVLPILRTIAETLDELDTLTEDDPKYRVAVEVLKGLNDSYEKIIARAKKELIKN